MAVRLAVGADIPRIIDMVEALAAAVKGAQRVDRPHTGATLAGLIAGAEGAVWVSGAGFFAARLMPTVINPELVAMELGWFASDGSGLRLLRAFEAWADGRRKVLSTGPNGLDLSRLGYRLTEMAWVK